MDVVITGASRGIGRALAVELARRGLARRLVLVARNEGPLSSLVTEIGGLGGEAVRVAGDLSSRSSARALSQQLSRLLDPGATVIHNAGIWPARRELNEEGLELAFVTNFVGPLILQQRLAADRKLGRTLVVGAGAMVLGRIDPIRTPTGEDFSGLRTYCSTKLCLAIAMRDFAAQHPDCEIAVAHPGVIRTDLGARPGLLGRLLGLVKRRWESPEGAAATLADLLSQREWGRAGAAQWFNKTKPEPWPAASQTEFARIAVRELAERYAGA